MEHYNVNQLLARLLLGKASENECAELEKRANKNEVQQIIDADDLADRYQYYAEADLDQALSEMQERMSRSYTRTKLLSPRFYRIAAVIALLIVGGTFWYHREYTRVTPPEIRQEVAQAMKYSRESGFQGGEIISSKMSTQKILTDEECTYYHVDDNFADQLEKAKRITTYHNKEYWVTLDDGSFVHLNNDSRLIYPEKFGDRREVILEGEAYFMIAHDRSRRFVVHTSQGDVKVYGTEFVVNTHKEANSVSVVLVKGSIGFTPSEGKEVKMVSGQQLITTNNNYILQEIDTTPYTAWIEGRMVFDNCPLDQLMQVIGRWFGINYRFVDSDLKKVHFSGTLDRYGNLSDILNAISTLSAAEISIKDGVVVLKKVKE